MIKLEKRGRRITIVSDAPLVGLKTAVPGAYQSVQGYWTVPLSMESCKLLKEKYGRQLVVGTELRRWARLVRDDRAYMSSVAASDDTDLERLNEVAPRLARAMNKRRYQRVGARFVADSDACLLAYDPGLGKTLIAMGGLLEAGIEGPYLVVAPKTASDSVWRREIIRWLPPEHRVIILPQLRDQRERRIRLTRYGPKTWLIVHPEIVLSQTWLICPKPDCKKYNPLGKRTAKMLSVCGHPKVGRIKKTVTHEYPKLFDIEWGAVIVDESHESLIVRKDVPTQRRTGLDLLKIRPGGKRIASSGTPFDSKPEQLWGTLNWLDPVTYSAFHRWAELFYQKGGYTGHEIGELRKDREQMLWKSLSSVVIRKTKAEVAPDLPPKIHIGTPLEPRDPDSPVGIWLPMAGKQAQAYADMEALSVAQLESGRLEAPSALEELTRLKQLASCYGDIRQKLVRAKCPSFVDSGVEECRECARFGYHKAIKFFYIPTLPSNKFDWIVENLEEWGYPKHAVSKVVIVSFYTGILEEFGKNIESHFRTSSTRPLCAYITGRTPSSKRRGIIDQFNAPGGPQIMFLNVKAGGTAITIDSADRMIMISETRVPTQQSQAEDRIHRVSNPRQCMYYYLRSLDTVDVGTAQVNQQMLRDTHRLLDERRGVDYMRQIIRMSHPPLAKAKQRS